MWRRGYKYGKAGCISTAAFGSNDQCNRIVTGIGKEMLRGLACVMASGNIPVPGIYRFINGRSIIGGECLILAYNAGIKARNWRRVNMYRGGINGNTPYRIFKSQRYVVNAGRQVFVLKVPLVGKEIIPGVPNPGYTGKNWGM